MLSLFACTRMTNGEVPWGMIQIFTHMKINLILIAFCLLFNACHLKHQNQATVHYQPDLTTNLKNPYMGWTLYSESRSHHTNGKAYWNLQDKAAEEYAGVFYLRWKWNDLEPTEGAYAWECDTVFQNLIQGALDRNLRLAFRAFVHTGTPQYVLDGASTYENWGIQTPYADDEFFLEKYTKFIEAFGKKFNDPTVVDYVDSYGLGWWGEGHNIKYKNPAKKHESHDRIVKTYATAFDKVINVINFGVRDETQRHMVYDELKFTPRRDGYASKWFPVKDQVKLVKHFPQTPIVAEACYWGKHEMDYHIESEGKKVWDTWGEYYEEVVDLALETRANYLDMRTEHETKRYMEEAPAAAKKFLSYGGYRIYPDSISYSVSNGQIHLNHTWTNLGVGVLPNNCKSLNNKYKVAFALFDKENNQVQQWLSDQLEVSKVLKGRNITVQDIYSVSEVNKGKYKLGVGIINTRKNDSKDIALAIKDANKIQGEWVYVGDVSN